MVLWGHLLTTLLSGEWNCRDYLPSEVRATTLHIKTGRQEAGLEVRNFPKLLESTSLSEGPHM